MIEIIMRKNLHTDFYLQFYETRKGYYRDYYTRNREKILRRVKEKYKRRQTHNDRLEEYIKARKEECDGTVYFT